MPRRPPGEGRLVARNPKALLALAAVVLVSWLPVADAQQQHSPQHPPAVPHDQVVSPDKIINNGIPVQNQPPLIPQVESDDVRRPRLQKSPFEGDHPAGFRHTTAAHRAPDGGVTQPHNRRHPAATPNHNKFYNNKNPNAPTDASALATLAPALAVRAPNTPGHLPSLLAGAGLSSPQSARSLENWEVEDYVLLATIDGHLHAIDRKTGAERWHLGSDQPVVESIHYRMNQSAARENSHDYHPLDDYVWAVEPSRHGAVYVWTPSGLPSGLMSTDFTMKQLVDDLGPYAVQNPPVVYTGHKKTTITTLDAATGMPLKWFGNNGSHVKQSSTCVLPDGGPGTPGRDECKNTGVLTISRTEYTVNIHRADDGSQIAELRYSEWGPNSFDSDLHQQYQTAHGDRYITSRTDGRLYSMGPNDARPLEVEYSGPVVHVFDIARPQNVPTDSNPELVLLPQPPPPASTKESADMRNQRVFLNQTESGSWYAMSGMLYPLVVDASNALLSQRQWWDSSQSSQMLDVSELSEALVGTHNLGNARRPAQWWDSQVPRLPSEPHNPPEQLNEPDHSEQLPAPSDPLALSEFTSENYVQKLTIFPQWVALQARDFITNPFWILVFIFVVINYRRDAIRYLKHRFASIKYVEEESSPTGRFDQQRPDTTPLEFTDASLDSKPQATEAQTEEKSQPSGQPESVSATPATDNATGAPSQDGPSESPEKPGGKKKAHRGRRGGVKHRKGPKKLQQESSDVGTEGGASTGIDDVPGLQNIGMPVKLEPNITTMNNDPEDVSGPIVRIGGIEVNQDDQLGMGSNGTVVFSGKFHGRAVAVKRMLTQFWDIASQETKLLLESDHHPNVIRYYAMSRNDSFLYIALELCQASLSDVIDKPQLYPKLAQAGEIDIPHVLLQISHGLSFLHDLRIVHRDLKPQNILVTMGRDGKPRLLVSDFGLCKKLEGGQSSFGATTAHAAGTSGWRAPELLLDDDARDSSTSMASTHSDSSALVSNDLMPNRRATRSIDIFSLGLVFFYVLTKGAHPFDCGDRYMREVNIRKGQFNLKPLEVLGDVATEAQALIATMLQANPKQRPTANDVMSHPFFWTPKERLAFLCDVSDHFELEPRDPPSHELSTLEAHAPSVCQGDFLRVLPKEFVDSLGKQRKYTGTRLLDLLRALRNKRFHYGDLNDSLKRMVGPLPEGYLGFWSRKFPTLLIVCCRVIYTLGLESTDTFKEYFKPRTPL